MNFHFQFLVFLWACFMTDNFEISSKLLEGHWKVISVQFRSFLCISEMFRPKKLDTSLPYFWAFLFVFWPSFALLVAIKGNKVGGYFSNNNMETRLQLLRRCMVRRASKMLVIEACLLLWIKWAWKNEHHTLACVPKKPNFSAKNLKKHSPLET